MTSQPQHNFKDHFSTQSKEYAIYRPNYPSVLFEYLNSVVAKHKTAWDCGTGTGQVALELTNYFDKIYASDASKNQIKNAIRHPKIEYFLSVAETTSLPDQSIDLITVAQAAHWFNLEAFYEEVKRVITSKGILAMWCYGFFQIPPDEERLESALQEFYNNIDSYWPPERQLVNNQYKTIPFPFNEIKSPQILMQKEWTINQLVGYLLTWSSTQRFIKEKGQNMMFNKLETIINSVSSAEKLITITWPIYWRIGSLC